MCQLPLRQLAHRALRTLIFIPMRHTILYFSLLLASLSGLLGCRQQGESPQARTETPVPRDSAALRLSLMPTLDCLPFYYAVAAGIYDSLGLEVRLATYDSQFDCDSSLLGRSADGSVSDLVRTRFYIGKGDSLEAVMATEGSWSLVVCGKLRVKSVQHMKDRLVAISRQSAADYYSHAALKKAKLEPDAVFRPQINNVFLRASMLDNNQIDAAVLPEPQATAACCSGHRRLYDGRQDTLRLGCLTFRKAVLAGAAGQEKLRLLLAGYDQAAARLNKEGAKACRTLLRDVYKLPSRLADTLRLPRYNPSHAPDAEALRQAADFLRPTE